MTVNELSNELKRMCNCKNNKKTMIFLFGIKYADEIQKSGYSCKEIVKLANIGDTYHTELSIAIKLAEFVSIKDEYLNL